MRIWQKLSAALLCLCTASFCGCADTNPPIKPPDTFPYHAVRRDRKTDGQYYANENVSFPAKLWQTPLSERYESLDRGDVRAYFIDSVQDTKVFCYVGIPAGASAQNKVPAVVLVHGATGTALYDWVELWVGRGYAAVAMDTEGRTPTLQSSTADPDFANCPVSNKPHGPVNSAFADSSRPVTEQWVYHAVAAVVASASFIASFPEVDGDKLGITGISYGGFLTCLAAGYDDRYSFAAPVYGCLSNAFGSAAFGVYMQSCPEAAALWDGLGPLAASRTPTLFVNNVADEFFAPDAISRCAAACEKGAVSFKPDFLHGHYQGARADEVFAFADEVFFGKNALPRLTGDVASGFLRIVVPQDVTITRAALYYTVSDTLNAQTEWK